jgi:hypothetical protein
VCAQCGEPARDALAGGRLGDVLGRGDLVVGAVFEHAGADRGSLVVGQRGERDVDLGELGAGDRLDALEHLVGELDARHAHAPARGEGLGGQVGCGLGVGGAPAEVGEHAAHVAAVEVGEGLGIVDGGDQQGVVVDVGLHVLS